MRWQADRPQPGARSRGVPGHDHDAARAQRRPVRPGRATRPSFGPPLARARRSGRRPRVRRRAPRRARARPVDAARAAVPDRARGLRAPGGVRLPAPADRGGRRAQRGQRPPARHARPPPRRGRAALDRSIRPSTRALVEAFIAAAQDGRPRAAGDQLLEEDACGVTASRLGARPLPGFAARELHDVARHDQRARRRQRPAAAAAARLSRVVADVARDRAAARPRTTPSSSPTWPATGPRSGPAPTSGPRGAQQARDGARPGRGDGAARLRRLRRGRARPRRARRVPDGARPSRERVDRLAVLDIVPTGEVWARADAAVARGYWHWAFLALPAPLPERLIAGDPDAFFDLHVRGQLGLGRTRTATRRTCSTPTGARSTTPAPSRRCARTTGPARPSTSSTTTPTARPAADRVPRARAVGRHAAASRASTRRARRLAPVGRRRARRPASTPRTSWPRTTRTRPPTSS